MGKVSEAQIKELLASKYLMGVEDDNGCRVNIPIEDLIEIIKENFKSNVDLFYNGIANINSEPEDDAVVEKSGFWFATDKGTYINYGGVVNNSDLSIISIDEDGIFQIKTVIDSFEGIISESFEEAKNALSDIIYDSIDTLNSDFNEYKANLNNDFNTLKNEVKEVLTSAYLGIATTTTTPPATGAYWYRVDAPGTYMGVTVTAEDFKDAQGNYFDVTLEVKDGVVVKRLSKKIPVDYSISELDSVSKNKAETGSTIFDFTKREIATINLFNKETFKENMTFNTTNGSITSSNAINGISDLIPTKPNTLYGMAQTGLNNSSVSGLYVVEYDQNKAFLGWQVAQSRATLKTGANTHYVRINPNSSTHTFDFWKKNFIFSEIGNFPIDYVAYGETEKPIFQNDLSFFEKHNFIETITLENQGVTFQNETLKITAGEKDFYNKVIFSLATLLKYSGEAVVVTRLKGNYQEFLPYFLDQYLNYSTTENAVSNFKLFYGSNPDEFFIATKGVWNKDYLFVFAKNMRLNGNVQNEINLKIEQFILYLDSSGKPRNLGSVSEVQLQNIANQLQALSNSVPVTINQQIASQVPAIIQQQIGSDVNAYLVQHVNDFNFLQPNYIQANSNFNFLALNSAMNGKFISIIQDIDLQGATIDFVAQNVKNLKLVFNGGRILNGKIKSNYTKCIFNSNEAFVNVEILNQFQNDFAIPEWFGAKIDGQDGGIGVWTKDDSFAFNQALKFASVVKLTGNRTMIVKKPIVLRTGNTIEADRNFTIKLGDASNCTLLKNENMDIPHDGINPVVYPQNFKRNKNITIRGGIWDGNGLKQNRAHNPDVGDQQDVIGTQIFKDGDGIDYFGAMMKFADIDDFLMENLTLKNGRTYMVACGGLTNYVFQNITQIRTHFIENGDGIHLHGHCYSGIIQDIKGQSGDDFVAVTTSEAGNLSIRVGDVIGLKIRNLYHYGLVDGASYSTPKEMTDGIPPMTKTKRCVRLTYTDNIIDDVTIENVRQLRGDFIVLVVMSYLHHSLFSGTNGKIGSVVIKGIKDNDGVSPVSVGANTKIDHVTVKDVFLSTENIKEKPAIFRQSDNFGSADQWALTEVGTVVMDNIYFLKGNTLWNAFDGLVWMQGKIKNIFINNLVVETKAGATKTDSLLSGRIDYFQITNSKVDVINIFSMNGNGNSNVDFFESSNNFGEATIGIVPRRARTESVVLPSNPPNPKIGDKILKNDGIYLFTTGWNKL